MFTRLKNDLPGCTELLTAKIPMDDILSSPYSYEQGYIKFIDSSRQGHVAHSVTDIYAREREPIVKIESLEKLNAVFFESCNRLALSLGHNGPVTCHLFKSPAAAPSFPLHTDPDTVIIVMLEGFKVFRNLQEEIEVRAGDIMMMPAHYPHEAITVTDSLMLSIGLESFITEKL